MCIVACIVAWAEQVSLARHSSILLFMCGLQKRSLQQVHLLVSWNSFMHKQDEALGAKLLLWLVHGMYILNHLTGL